MKYEIRHGDSVSLAGDTMHLYYGLEILYFLDFGIPQTEQVDGLLLLTLL